MNILIYKFFVLFYSIKKGAAQGRSP